MASTRIAVLTALTMLALAGCGGGEDAGHHDAPSPAPTAEATAWVDQDVSFAAGGLTVHATYRHPTATAPGPAVLLIAGSGPTDRDGNQDGSQDNSLRLLAGALAEDGVATLRYDKLFSGETGAGPYASDPAKAGVSVFLDEARAALVWLAGQPRSDAAQIGVVGHSEGGLYALLLATDKQPDVPKLENVALIEPLSRRFLDIVAEQLHRQLAGAAESGQLSQAAATGAEQQIDAAIAAVRAGKPPGDVPSYVKALFGPTVLPYLRQIDGYDPADVAARLSAGTRVLLTCSANDPQITCADTDHLAGGLRRSPVTPDYQQLTGMDHALKADDSADGAKNDADLPLFPGLASALSQFYTHRR